MFGAPLSDRVRVQCVNVVHVFPELGENRIGGGATSTICDITNRLQTNPGYDILVSWQWRMMAPQTWLGRLADRLPPQTGFLAGWLSRQIRDNQSEGGTRGDGEPQCLRQNAIQEARLCVQLTAHNAHMLARFFPVFKNRSYCPVLFLGPFLNLPFLTRAGKADILDRGLGVTLWHQSPHELSSNPTTMTAVWTLHERCLQCLPSAATLSWGETDLWST